MNSTTNNIIVVAVLGGVLLYWNLMASYKAITVPTDPGLPLSSVPSGLDDTLPPTQSSIPDSTFDASLTPPATAQNPGNGTTYS